MGVLKLGEVEVEVEIEIEIENYGCRLPTANYRLALISSKNPFSFWSDWIISYFSLACLFLRM